MNGPPLKVKVWGEYACFTRPELKVERVSYPVMTPSAARGVLEAIFWKPEIEWHVRRIDVLNEIRHFSILRNEVNNKAVYSSARAGDGFYADENKNRAQRHTLALRDVAYVIHANIVLKPHADADVAKYRDQFRRRVSKGQCYHTPYLGCREFVASFGEPDGGNPIGLTDDLGLMLFDLDYALDGSGRGKPHFFRARLDRGILNVPLEMHQKEERNAS